MLYPYRCCGFGRCGRCGLGPWATNPGRPCTLAVNDLPIHLFSHLLKLSDTLQSIQKRICFSSVQLAFFALFFPVLRPTACPSLLPPAETVTRCVAVMFESMGRKASCTARCSGAESRSCTTQSHSLFHWTATVAGSSLPALTRLLTSLLSCWLFCRCPA
jgi:hypothetical protein